MEYDFKECELKEAVKNNDINNVKLLLQENEIDPSANSNMSIRVAAEYGYTEILTLLLNDNRVDPSDYEDDAFRYAAEKGHLDIAKILLKDKRVDPKSCNNWAITKAMSNKHLEVVEFLWNLDLIKNTLQKDDLELYNKLITN
jgi:ankyrin repeat protein